MIRPSAQRARYIACIALAFASALPLAAQAADPAALQAFPDFLNVRSEFLSAVVTAPAATALNFRTAFRDTPAGRIRVSVERQGQSFYVLFLGERDGAYPYAGRGNIIVKRSATNNFIQQIKWILSDDGLSWVSLTPRNEQTLVDYVVGGSLVRSGLVVRNLLYYFFMQPFRYLHDMTRSGLDWRLTLGPEAPASQAALAKGLGSPTGPAAALAKAAVNFAAIDAYLSAIGASSILPEEEKVPVAAQQSQFTDERESGPYRTSAWSAERGLPLGAASAVMLSRMAEGAAFIGFVDSVDGRYPYKLILVPYSQEGVGFAIAAYDAEAKRFMNWGDFVRSRPEASIRLFRLPAPR